MSLTLGRGPFGQQPAGTFNFQPPDEIVYVEEFWRRVRAMKGGATVIASDRVKMVHRSGRLPHYAFPQEDVHVEAQAEPHAEGYVTVAWNAVDAWFEEDEEVFVHPRDPYHRIDVLPTSRRVRVSLQGVVLAESTEARALYETGLPIRWYLPFRDVRLELLEPSPTITQCAYKGSARPGSARVNGELIPDGAWVYEDTRPEADRVRGRLCFYNERVDLEIDGEAQRRPPTPWSR
jgi:uncharacterized protein (DUF427 family)